MHSDLPCIAYAPMSATSKLPYHADAEWIAGTLSLQLDKDLVTLRWDSWRRTRDELKTLAIPGGMVIYRLWPCDHLTVPVPVTMK